MKTGRPTTKPGRKRVTFNLPPEDMEKLKRIAQAQGISASELLHQTIEKLAREKMNYEAESETTDNRLLGIARAMHGELCDCDDKNCSTQRGNQQLIELQGKEITYYSLVITSYNHTHIGNKR